VIDTTSEVYDHISLPPEFSWTSYDVEGPCAVVWLGAEEVPDVVDPDGFGFPGDIVLPFPRREWLGGVALDAITAVAVRALHEGFEWVKVDGQRMATPHPEGDAEEESWQFLTDAIGKVVKEYAERWPVEP